MTKKTYRGHIVELTSEQTHPGEWIARATIIVEDGKTNKKAAALNEEAKETKAATEAARA